MKDIRYAQIWKRNRKDSRLSLRRLLSSVETGCNKDLPPLEV